MGDISALIEVFRMDELSKSVRADTIIKLGTAINDTYSSNITEPIVVELVKILSPNHGIFSQEHYQKYLNHKPKSTKGTQE